MEIVRQTLVLTLFDVAARGLCGHLFVTFEKQVPSPFIADLYAERWQRI
jgi:hypothetical protein